ncbi:MAG: DUF5020 family protein [Bacteroidales bacterium]|nr:DUF5020 family protein [Bacteroidales bacterium]
MRKLLLFVLLFAAVGSYAQNLQVHYDMGKDRGYMTSTMEMFKPDKMGNTFFFIDMDYGSNDAKGVSLAYWEIARVFKTEKMPLGIHVEYNGGFGNDNKGGTNFAYRINDSWLAGLDYSLNAKDFSKGITFKGLFKHIRDKHDASFQLTSVWYVNFLKNKMTFSGFADFWKEDKDFDFDGVADTEFTFLCEPQLWYHICDHMSVGGEVEFANNFGDTKGFQVNPTLGLKWTF